MPPRWVVLVGQYRVAPLHQMHKARSKTHDVSALPVTGLDPGPGGAGQIRDQ